MTSPTAPSPGLGEREAVARTERPGFNFIELQLRCNERADMPEEISPDTLREAASAIHRLRRERHEFEAESTRLRAENEKLRRIAKSHVKLLKWIAYGHPGKPSPTRGQIRAEAHSLLTGEPYDPA